jgi:4-carboxymuconolactone decarboxylase
MPRKPHDHYLSLKDRHPKLIAAVEALGAVAQDSGPLDLKTIHLIQLAAAAAIKSHGSTHSHTIRALESGATPEEVRHAVIVLTRTIGFPSVAAAMNWVDDVLERGY